MFVRTLLHIDARALTFVESDGGKKTASADVLGMVFDQEGTEVAHLSTGFAVALTKDAADEALRDGLVYTLRIPIPRSGAYQVRFAVRDQRSGVLGSAGEFVDVATWPAGRSLSGIVLRSDDGPPPARRDRVDGGAGLRVYRPGRGCHTHEVYNATTVQAITVSGAEPSRCLRHPRTACSARSRRPPICMPPEA
jgi:hypothetical protein